MKKAGVTSTWSTSRRKLIRPVTAQATARISEGHPQVRSQEFFCPEAIANWLPHLRAPVECGGVFYGTTKDVFFGKA
jgi:hypothetical protein